jgi:hypothetical protein
MDLYQMAKSAQAAPPQAAPQASGAAQPPMAQLLQAIMSGQQPTSPLAFLADPKVREKIMREQMDQAQNVSNAVPRVRPFPTEYQPPQYWNFGSPVRMA